MTEKDSASFRFEAPMERIRDAAKWLIGASAAVGAVLIAGSQLSSIGQLRFGVRLGLAAGGVALALAAVVWAIWAAVQVLLPVGVTLGELEQHWAADKRADVRFFRANPGQFGYADPTALKNARVTAWDAREEKRVEWEAATDEADRTARKEQFDSADAEFTRIDGDMRTVQQTAQYQLLKDRFGKVLQQLLGAAVLTAVGIMLFAWAGNPAKPVAVETSLKNAVLRDADLRDAHLTGADLRGADLTGADLTGAHLTDATLKDVTWKNTTCPDGTNSDEDRNTCRGHLEP